MEQNNNLITQKQFYLSKSVSLLDKYNFYEYLSIMIDGGVTITSCLDSVRDKIKNPYFKEKLKDLQLYIASGDQLSKAMKKLPDVFNSQEYSIIEAGEKSGTLVDSLTGLASEFKKLHDLRSKIKSSLTYPAIIMLFLLAAVFVIMIVVIPGIMPLIEESGVEKPIATVALIATSNFFVNNFILLIIFIFLVISGFYVYKSTDTGKQTIDEFLLGVPLIGNVYKNYILASTSTILGMLLNAGVPIVQSLILVGKTTNNQTYEAIFNEVSQKVGRGKKLVESIQETDPYNNYFPLDFLQLLSVGEKTASIGKVTKKLNEQYTREVSYSLDNLTKWIEPLAILIAGVFVLWFAFAIFGAILKLTTGIS